MCVSMYACAYVCEVDHISLVQTQMESAQQSHFAKNMPPKPCTFVYKKELNPESTSRQCNSQKRTILAQQQSME